MSTIHSITHSSPAFPQQLDTIYNPPQQLRYIGNLTKILEMPRLAVVGSRKVSPYGRAVTNQLTRDAAANGIAILSGLALGVDGIAHQSALEAGGTTAAIMPCGLSRIYPSSHQHLAKQIIEKDGVLISEYPDDMAPFKNNFIERNRLVSGLADAVLITEAAAKSGTLHTANFALDQGKVVMAVPGNITSELSAGTNNLIKAGAIPVTNFTDILSAMGLVRSVQTAVVIGSTEEETTILRIIQSGVSEGSEIQQKSELPPATFNQTLTMLEIQGKISPLGAGHWGLS